MPQHRRSILRAQLLRRRPPYDGEDGGEGEPRVAIFRQDAAEHELQGQSGYVTDMYLAKAGTSPSTRSFEHAEVGSEVEDVRRRS